jgi:hypothetical protein
VTPPPIHESLADGRWGTRTTAGAAHGATRFCARARAEFCRLFFDPDPPAGSADGLRRYFLAFATAANRQRRA